MKGMLKLLTIALLAAPSLAHSADDPSAARIKADMAYLASDRLKGREAGTAEYDMAAGYVMDQMKQMLTATGLEPRSLKLEITESLIMENPEVARALLLRLKALDIQLGIDDFGTGYSSLSYLHRFPIDRLKIDRSFVGPHAHVGDEPDHDEPQADERGTGGADDFVKRLPG